MCCLYSLLELGLLITLADLGLKRVGLHGPGPLQHFLQATRNVSVRSSLTVDCYPAQVNNYAPPHSVDAATAAAISTSVPSVASSSSNSPHFTDSNISVDVIVLAEHPFKLPPLRPVWQPNAANTQHTAMEDATTANSSAATTITTAASSPPPPTPTSSIPSSKPFAQPQDNDPEPYDKSIDDTPRADTVTGGCSHTNSHCPAKRPREVESTPPSANQDPIKLSYSSINQARELAKQEADWVTTIHPSLVAYIVTLADTPGKFDLAKAKALGIPPGPLYAKLKGGESVYIRKSQLSVANQKKNRPQKKNAVAAAAAAAAVAESSTPALSEAELATPDDPLLTFHPTDCVAASTPGPKFAVVDCPNEAFVEKIIDAAAFKPYRAGGEATGRLTVMVHFAPHSILTSPSYSAWMISFGPTTHHICAYSNRSITPPVFRAAGLNALKMRDYVCKKVFPTDIGQSGDYLVDDAKRLAHELSSFPDSLRSHLHPAAPMLRYHLLAGRKDIAGIDVTSVPKLIDSTELAASLTDASTSQSLANLNKWRETMEWDHATPEEIHAKVATLKNEISNVQSASAVANDESKMSDVAPISSSSSAFPVDIELTDPAPIPDFQSDPTTLEQLARESDHTSPHFLFLGTGSAIPSKYRNVTGQVFHPGYIPSSSDSNTELPSHPVGAIVMDCGEGTYGQMCLRYTSPQDDSHLRARERVDNMIADLKAVWISHIHADHHLGLLSVVSAYKQTWLKRYDQAMPSGSPSDHGQIKFVDPSDFTGKNIHEVPKLMIIGPRRLYHWLMEYSACAFQIGAEDQFDPSSSPISAHHLSTWFQFVTCSELLDRSNAWTKFFREEHPSIRHRYPSVHTRPIQMIQTVQVRHCHDAYGLIIESGAPSSSSSSPTYKLVVSGDTQPCQSLIDAGADATLLIHEATLEDDMIAEAREKRHSTTRQAIEVGLKMRAQRILLTHFSQRYPKIPTYSEAFSSRTAIAFDLMEVRFNQLQWLPSLTPAFAWCFDAEKVTNEQEGEED